MKTEPCPQCGTGKLRRRTSRTLIEGEREEVWRECNQRCGYRERLIVRPAVIVDRQKVL